MYKLTECTESMITALLLQGLMYACVQCKRPGEELDRVWSDMSLHCPLMLVSAAVLSLHWLSFVFSSITSLQESF